MAKGLIPMSSDISRLCLLLGSLGHRTKLTDLGSTATKTSRDEILLASVAVAVFVSSRNYDAFWSRVRDKDASLCLLDPVDFLVRHLGGIRHFFCT